jgi:uncharacterized membrane protein
MTHTDDVNDEGNPSPVLLDLTDDNAYYVITQALTDFAHQARGRAEGFAHADDIDTTQVVEQLDMAELAEALRVQIETQIDTLSAPQEESE